MSSRRPSTQYPKTVQSVDPRLANSTDSRTQGSVYDPYYNPNQDSWASSNTQPQMQDTQKPYLPNEQMDMYGHVPAGAPQPPYRTVNRQDALQQQQNMDQSSQQYSNQGRRLSSTVRSSVNQRPQGQEWNVPQRRQSVLAQPQYDPQGNLYVDGGTASYGRNEFRSGTVASEGALERQQMASDPQGYRQPMDPQGYRQIVDQQGYRQTPDKQMYRQGPSDQQTYRQSVPTEQDALNGVRAPGSRPSIDYFDHYKRPPSRGSSVDRFGRQSRQPSVEAVPPSGGSRAGSVAPQPPMPSSRPPSRAATPASNGHLATGRGSISRAGSREQPFEDSLIRKRTLGQEISPSPYQPKRTESLYVAQNPAPPPPAPKGGGGGGGGGGGRKVCTLYISK